jgi:hypothetical protein
MIRRNRIIVGVVSLGLAVGLGYAIRARASGIPSTGALSYAGVLDDANGPITGSHNIQVILYDAASGGNNLCQTTSAAINITNGQFSVLLPDACTTAVGANPNVWVDVLVDGADTGTTKIGAVPYAVEANHTPNADNATTAATANAAGGTLATTIGNLAATSAVPTVTAWTAYTPTVTSSSTGTTISNLTTTGRWRRVGDTAEVSILTTATGAPSGPSGEFWVWSLPTGVDIDTSALPSPGATLGSASAYGSASTECDVVPWASGASLEVGCQGDGASVQSGVPFTWASGNSIGIRVSGPVVGWSVH